ncbi:hypothetical protein [uncultured Thiohalocapsa sp.]|uniref:hypothetical protein n=1 Tax=uncultured Thiohalocapsa sp. TaxID=768990 RepID=UPI0025E25D19|nr:hypothetical protein [uncultured Thiohalocapsa sp.]
MYRYRFFDLPILVDFPVPELPSMLSEQEATDQIRVRLKSGLERPKCWYVEWPAAAPVPEVRAGSIQGGYLLDYPRVAAYRIDDDGCSIDCERYAGAAMSEVRRLLIDQALPRLFAHRDNLVLHAAGVELWGSAICLMGPSGFGKSTLSAALVGVGGTVLCDDALRVDCCATGVSCVGAYPGMRLWPDSVARTHISGYRQSPVSPVSSKLRCLPEVSTEAAQLVPLGGVVLLDQPVEGGPGHIELSPTTRMEAMAYLLSQCFKLDTSDSGHVSRILGKIGCVVEAKPVVRISYPRRYELLPSVVSMIASGLLGRSATG